MILSSLLMPYERYLWAGLAVVLLVSGMVMVHHLKQEGVAQQQAADAKVEAAQVIHVQEVESRAQVLSSAADTQLAVSLAAPVTPGFTLSVCPSPVNIQRGLPADGGPQRGSVTDRGLHPRVGVTDEGAQSGTDIAAPIDIAAPTETILARANAKLIYWQEFYMTCRSEGACR